MNFVYISPQFPKTNWEFCDRLKQNGVTVLGIADVEYNELDEKLKNALTEYYRVSSLENYDEVLKAVGFFTHKYGKIDWIESNNEYWLVNDSRLRTDFNVTTGIQFNKISGIKEKSKMKKSYKKAGIPTADYSMVTTLAKAKKFIEKVGYPVITKPDNGVGAAATFKLETAEDVERFKQEWDHQTAYFFEKFVQSGEICTFDGLVDKDGNIVFSTTFDYAHTPLDLMIYKMDNSYYVLKDMDPKLRAYGEAIVKIFGMKERFFHIEFFRDGDDYVAIEYNNRPAGGFTIDVYNFAHLIDLYKGYAAIVAGEPFPAAQMEPLYCLATSRRASTNYAYPEADLLEKYRDNFKVKKDMPAAFAELQGDYLYMLTTPSREQMEQMIADFAKQAD